MYASGCRPRELRTIQISKIDFEAREIRVMGKCGDGSYRKERILLITKRALDLIKQYLTERKSRLDFEDVLFLNDRGEGLSASELNKMVKKYVFQILHKEIKHNNPAYILRHSFATMMMNRDVDIPYIAQFLGHEAFSSTQIYTHTSIKRLIEQHKKFHPLENPKHIVPYCEEPERPSWAVVKRAKETVEKRKGV